MTARAKSISLADGLAAIMEHVRVRAKWMVKAHTLLQLAGSPGTDIDREKLAAECRKHAEAMP